MRGLSCLFVIAVLSGNCFGAEPVNTVDELTFGDAVGGLAIAARLEKSALRPGQRLDAEIYFRNVSDKALVVVPYSRGRFGWSPTDPNRPYDNAAALHDTAARVKLAPGETVLAAITQLEDALNMGAEGKYALRYEYKLTRDALGTFSKQTPAELEKLWETLQKEGVWSGTVSSAIAKFEVSANAPESYAGRSRKVATSVTAIDNGVIKINKSGEAGLFTGAVLYLPQEGKPLAPFRIKRDREIEPLLPEIAIKAGDKLEATVDDSYWLRSTPGPDGGRTMNGLKLALDLKLQDGKWSATLTGSNAGKTPITVFPRAEMRLNIVSVEGSPPELTRCMGSGVMDPEGDRKGCVTLAPGASAALLVLQEHETLTGNIGRNHVGWKFAPGKYRFSVICRVPVNAVGGVENPWTGSAESNAVVVEVK